MDTLDKRKKAIRECRQWLENFGWTWHVRLKIRTRTITDAEMKALFNEWILRIKQTHGGKDFRWVRVLENRSTKGKRHFHVLIGGLRNRRQDAESAWCVIGGDSIVDRYDADKGGILSLLKTMDDKRRLDIDFSLPMTPGVWPPISIADQAHREGLDPEDENVTTLRVANIGEDTSPGDLRRLFSSCGTVSDVWIHSSPKSTFGLLDIRGADAAKAVKYMNGRRWRGRELRIELAASDDFGSAVRSTVDFDEDDNDAP